jgi:hypothetical protein
MVDIVTSRPNQANRGARRNWRSLPLVELEQQILDLRRLAARGVHLDNRHWAVIDAMRKRAAKLAKEAA